MEKFLYRIFGGCWTFRIREMYDCFPRKF